MSNEINNEPSKEIRFLEVLREKLDVILLDEIDRVEKAKRLYVLFVEENEKGYFVTGEYYSVSVFTISPQFTQSGKEEMILINASEYMEKGEI